MFVDLLYKSNVRLLKQNTNLKEMRKGKQRGSLSFVSALKLKRFVDHDGALTSMTTHQLRIPL